MNISQSQEEEKKKLEKKAEKQKFVLYSEYLTLKQKFEKLKIINREMSQILESMNKSIKQITNSHASVNTIYNDLVKVDEIKEFLHPGSSISNLKEKNTEFSLKANSESLMSLNKQKGINNEKDIKKLEELEFFLSEMSKNYNYTVIKYKYMKNDKDKSDELNSQLTHENIKLHNTTSNLKNEINRLENIIKKQKITEKYLVDSISSIYSISEKKDLIFKPNDNNDCKTLIEPLPTILKFMK